MDRNMVAALAMVCMGLCGCSRALGSADGDHHGRYAGVGIYGPSRQWTKLVTAQQTKDPQTAQPIDDQVIIVVQDSSTGEIRACGDLTGYCIGMNPWKSALVSAQIAPLKLTEHRKPDATVELTAKPPKPDPDGAGDAGGHSE